MPLPTPVLLSAAPLAAGASPGLRLATLTAGVGAAAVGGVFFAFSTFVMPALRRLPDAAGASAMQQINVTAVRPPLMTLLFGTAAVAAGLGVVAVRSWGDRRATLLLAGAVLYLVGAVVVTSAVSVPLNDALARSAGTWSTYAPRWTLANHVRTVTCLAGAACFLAALREGPAQL